MLNNACNKIYFDYPKNSNTFAVKIKSYIDSKYMDINNLKDFAMQNNKSKSLVSSTFKSEYGISPKKYLNNLRVQEAIYRLVLRGKDEKVVDIAYDVGFKDLSRFNKQFKLFTRNTPRDMK